ncbi:MAG: WxL domain-containing protein, partial [Bifidobacteriaceae bacterium]|nr:WxL domain-containing protein [Bifidobacteriaceae bacterium]
LENTVTLAPVTLSGADQTTSADLQTVTVDNGRGTTAGWTLSGQATAFVGDNGYSLPASNLGWTPTAAVVPGSYTPPTGTPASTVTAGSPVNPGTAGLANARTLASAPSGASAGRFTAGGSLTLGVPGNTKVGRYTSVLTLTLQ